MKPEIRTFKVKGISPLLMHNPRPPQGNAHEKPRTPEEWAEAHAYRGENGLLCLPSVMFRASLLDAADGEKSSGRGTPSDPSLSHLVFPADEQVVLRDPETDEGLERYKVRKSRVRENGRSVPRSRPEIRRWACVLRLEIDTDEVAPERVEELLNVAGRNSGVGDYRPQRGGTYGRYAAALLPEDAVPAAGRAGMRRPAAYRRFSPPAPRQGRYGRAKG